MAKVGRNDPCPCGSGKKYKKCCLENEEPQVLPNSAPGVDSDLAGGGWGHAGSHIPYATEAYLRANPDSPVARMESLAREAEAAEGRGDPVQAYETYRRVLALAPNDGMKRTVLQDLEMLCMSNVPVRDRGPEVTRELEDLDLKFGDEGQAAQSAAERADFLEALGRGDEATKEYQRALSAYPRSPWLRIRHARFLTERGDREGAKASYRDALSLPDDHDAHATAKEELGES